MKPDPFAQTQLIVLGFILSTIMLMSGCRQVAAPSAATGQSSFSFVEAPPPKPRNATSVEPTDKPLINDYFIEAKPIEPLITPIYPPKALSGKAGLVLVGVRVMVDAEGRVTEVGPSLLTFSTPNRYAEEFQEAVRVAVRRWRFRPAQRYSERVDQDGEHGNSFKELRRENTGTYFDLSFTFTATGRVVSGLGDE